MTEEYKGFITGVFVGILTLLFLQMSFIAFGLRKIVVKKKYPDTYHKDLFTDPPNELASLLSIATKECTDLAWLNISLQRFFYELTKSSTFYEKVKSTLIKKMSMAFATGILKRVRFKDISFGSEAPYIKSIRALSEDEIEELLNKKELSQNKPAHFKQVYLLISMDYTANDNCIFIDADLIKGYSIPIMVKLQPFKGDLLLRMPANNYSTRFEITFIKNPGFNFSVEASFSKNDSAFFTNTLSHLIKRLCQYISKMYIFPNWYYYYLPMVVYRAKTILYTYYPWEGGSIEGPMHQAREVQNLFSLDFGIVKKWENIIFRRTKSTVNTSNTVLERAEIELINKHSIITELFSRETIEIFSDVISDYESIQVVESLGVGVDLINIIIANQIYEFIRIIVDELVIYQRTDPEEPQFIAFKKETTGGITVLQYVNTTEAFYLGQFRIKKLAKKLERQEMKVLGSVKLFKFLDYSVKQAKKTKDMFKIKPEITRNESQKSSKTHSQISVKDTLKEKYISDGCVQSIPENNPSEVSIIESHFKEIQKNLTRPDQNIDFVINLPYTQKEISEIFNNSLLRSAILGCFTLMEDIPLTENIRNSSMAHISGQYVQMLSYYSEEDSLLIERILLSEEYQGVTAAVQILEGVLHIFIFGTKDLYLENFVKLTIPFLERNRIISLQREEINKKFIETLKDSSGFVMASDIPVVCSMQITVPNEISFDQEVLISSTPFIFRYKSENKCEITVSIKTKKNAKVEMCTIPYGEANKSEESSSIKNEDDSTYNLTDTQDIQDISSSSDSIFNSSTHNEEQDSTPEVFTRCIHIEGDIILNKKCTVNLFTGTGLIYWCTEWQAVDKIKDEEIDGISINGSGYSSVDVPVQIYCKNSENKSVTKHILVGIIS
ncbi:hypothetical protein NEIRO03_1863 [Nematocida sp. AWRm78]|nr:hypothetical protein NEIRO03_1863 [Nematocida sp. AWRm78]